jgi:hypothetical protein
VDDVSSAMSVIAGILVSSLKEYNRPATNLTNVQQVGRALGRCQEVLARHFPSPVRRYITQGANT